MKYTIKVNSDDILLTQNELTTFLKGLAEIRQENDEKKTASYINYLRTSNSIDNLIKNNDVELVKE